MPLLSLKKQLLKTVKKSFSQAKLFILPCAYYDN